MSEIDVIEKFDGHQQYLETHRNGYCGLGGTGVACPVGLGLEEGS
ncbi:hypothetical protein [Longimycelium tulufanense]|nr:hypothetical protein [Longimycelium tulufanense]